MDGLDRITPQLPRPRVAVEEYHDDYQRAAAGTRGRLGARITELKLAADRVLRTPVIGPRGQFMTVHEAKHRAEMLTEQIDTDELRGSLRHYRVSRSAKALTLFGLVVVDFPVMLWLASSVFNVDWTNPLGLPLVISFVISVLATGGAATALYHLGHNQRENKDDRRRLTWRTLSRGSKLSMLAAVVLVGLIAAVMFVRVYTEGELSGLDSLAFLLAVLVAFVMLISAALVFWTAFRDGSLEQDDLRCYSAMIMRCESLRREYEVRVGELTAQLQRLEGEYPFRATVDT
ncbi:hypothetical protein [Amycolatopsis regifaucium]|uniref:Uncharacterized protein n=1 Tax=Amycolatopsis regifaucium TaxID=546365 RepID=A0A154MQR4_9PSEU|nr:hypothetical protein [Amycolatopsis regifaucium]KZB85779.1 hypothetical protein AVL48_30495 [Amycolatopsis regifaucium]OKA10466.1 hypothetical protein ATP06_0203410 [Amycolatopsis regifaucium]SFI78269.1 hypothetical protein SAMN04489731_11352 [Amycolatopsis regifaucium]